MQTGISSDDSTLTRRIKGEPELVAADRQKQLHGELHLLRSEGTMVIGSQQNGTNGN